MVCIRPARDPVPDAIAFARLVRRHAWLGMTDVQIVEDERATGLQRLANVPDHCQVVRWIFEVAEAREQVDDAVVMAAAEREPHVLPDEPEIGAFVRPGFPEALG